MKPNSKKLVLFLMQFYKDEKDPTPDDQKGMKSSYSEDGVHPNKEVYSVMEKTAEPVILKILGKKK
jgi:lysophospholipase L1-like esterase